MHKQALYLERLHDFFSVAFTGQDIPPQYSLRITVKLRLFDPLPQLPWHAPQLPHEYTQSTGQQTLLHCLVSRNRKHLPPHDCLFRIVRCLFCVPPLPHVREQVPQDDQADKVQSEGEQRLLLRLVSHHPRFSSIRKANMRIRQNCDTRYSITVRLSF